MDKIAFVAPYSDIAVLARDICIEKYPDVKVFEGLLEEGLACAREALNEGCRVIISRGGTANLIRHHIAAPVVEIRVTGYDILRTFSEFIGLNPRIGVAGYRNVVEGCNIVSQMLKLPLQELLTIDSGETPKWEDIQELLQRQIVKNPVDVLIGDSAIVKKLRLNIPQVRLIQSGVEAVSEAIEQAYSITKVQIEEKKAAEQLHAILNFIHDGVLAVDSAGNIQVFNPGAEKIFNIKPTDIIGRNIKEVLPNFQILDILRNGKPEFEQLHPAPSGMIVTNRIPIKVDGKIKGAVATFQEAGKIQKTERKIRKTLYAKGLYAKYSFSDILAWDSEMRRVIERAKRYANTDGTVLIQAESGCGKELFAQSIHKASTRRDGPFVAVNCSALPNQLLESELFGYVEGAFTGARKEGKAGLVELAHGGTLFLDEIGDMELGLQARLLRVLEERQVMRLGADNWIPVNIRIIAATNVPLKRRAFDGLFRTDLFFRLNVLSLLIPPLRQRQEDIFPLANYFLASFAEKYGHNTIILPDEAKKALAAYTWPGNVRELRNIMERLVLVYEYTENILGLLNDFLHSDNNFDLHNRGESNLSNSLLRPESGKETSGVSIKEMKHQLALDTLNACGGNKTQAAKQLGVTRYTLDRILKNG